jgi:sodium/bile acid cotransporter 7
MAKLFRLFDPYIATMIGVVALAAILPARGAGAQIAGGAADAGIVFLFFLYGARLSPQLAIGGLMHWRLHVAVLLSTYALFPALGVALAQLAPTSLPKALATGIIFLCLLPSTVQSSIAFTSIARGNVPAALCAASASNIVGIFLTPLLAGWILQRSGVALTFGQFGDIILQLLAPFLAGQLLRHWIGAWIQRHRAILSYADRGLILLIIYVAFSRSVVDNIWAAVELDDLLLLSVLLVALLAMILLLTLFIGRKLMRLNAADEIVLQFCGSKKSLASGLPMATVLFAGPQLGLILLPLMLFHQMQLIVCAILAGRYARRPDPNSSER